MSAPQQLLNLVARFDTHRDSYTSGQYHETQLRREFIDPLFKCLGWDIDNAGGLAEAYKDVIHEDAIKIGGLTKAPDYCFRIGGVRKYFVEAKKPSINLKEDITPAFQLRRYAWSAKLPLSILTDFEEFAVYDCRIKPVKTDKASTARTLYIKSTEYADRWDELASIFSKDAVLKGSFDAYADTTAAKRGTAEVDDVFLKEIESWRDALARNIALRNPDLSQRELNFAVQRTIDRIIFLRICEDRGIESYGQLQSLQNGREVYARLRELYHRADERYNSGLFHFRAEKDVSEPPDELTLGLTVDDTALKGIIKDLYYPDSPYEFSVLPASILGQVYEQFLGKVIRLTPGHRAVVEEKPEVKKAGGVYYTPSYIVDYIVKHTVGKLIEGKTPRQIAELRVLDPACGSGSFLLGAYEYLLSYHRDWYTANDPEKFAKGKQPSIYQGPGGAWRLTSAEKKRILLNNIYGVDIDRQAVEVTKLSLLLKVLEDENGETLSQQIALFQERALPSLERNIKCGNSLIGPEVFKGQLIPDADEMYRINPFDWQHEFPAVMRDGGFDCVIGNPPYIRIQRMKEWAPREVELYKQLFSSASAGNYDIYVVFAEKALSLLNPRGRMGFILPNKFLSTDYGLGLRRLIAERHALDAIVDFGHGQVFSNATTYTCLLFLTAAGGDTASYRRVISPPTLSKDSGKPHMVRRDTFTAQPWILGTDAEDLLIKKLERASTPLGRLPGRIGRGSSSGADEVFILGVENGCCISGDGEHLDIEKDALRIPIHATDFGRYAFSPRDRKAIVFPYEVSTEGYKLFAEKEFMGRFPKAYSYLAGRRKQLERRRQFQEWYGFSAPRNLDVHASAQLLVPLLAKHGSYCRIVGDAARYCLMASGGFSITVDPACRLAPSYVLGLLNSSLLFWRLRSISNVFRGGWITCTKQYVGTLPIRVIDFESPTQQLMHNGVIELVEHMLSLHEEMTAAKLADDMTAIQRQIDATDKEIDRLVYELYDLTEEEIRIVEAER